MLRRWGRMAGRVVAETGDFTLFVTRALAGAPGSRHLRRRVLRAVYEQGIRTLPVILVVGGFTGLVLGLQGYYQLSRFGSTSALGSFVALTLTRELAPVLAALMIVGQAGSALAAELGIQRNTEQIDALETMGIDPHAFLVAPRLLGSLVVFPIMTTWFALVGLVGGYASGSVLLYLEPSVYWGSVFRATGPDDILQCFLKATTFGLLTTAVCAHNGFNTHRRSRVTGARAVSASTTRAVVLSSMGVLTADYALTSFLL